MTHAVCFHLHCYQPPREDPWLGIVEPEPSAFPYHDWNQRITAECYRPNTAAAVLGPDGLLAASHDNFAGASFDIVTTLHQWLAEHAPDVDAVVRAAARADGQPTGAALASPAIHAILPLAHPDDRETLVAWGVADFVARFGFRPQGMWLPETAVDVDTLATVARHGIRFVVLMPQQARRVRARGGHWTDVGGEQIDPTRPYFVRLPDGGRITVVFGHGPLSRGVAFDGLLNDGTALAAATKAALSRGRRDELVAIVTDGETFGHHHRFGEMALAWAMRSLEDEGTDVVNLGTWLRTHPATWEVELVSPSAWSCAHGVGRWRADCGCSTAGEPGWDQAWRAPLRDALDWLRAALAGPADAELQALVGDARVVIDDYSSVLTGAEAPADFVARHARRTGRTSDDARTTRVLELLELRRHLLASTTSCAWFFADPGRVETVLSLTHAAVALDIAARVLEIDAEAEFLDRLDPMRSNVDQGLTGRALWERMVAPRSVDPVTVAAGFAMEAAASPDVSARARRGVWLVTPGEITLGGGSVSGTVVVEHTATRRRTEVEIDAACSGAVGVRARVRPVAAPEWRECTLRDARPDMVARVGTARLTGDGDRDPLEALRHLTADLRTRSAEVDDVDVISALVHSTGPLPEEDEGSVRAALAVVRDAAASSPEAFAALSALAPLAAINAVEWPAASGGDPAAGPN